MATTNPVITPVWTKLVEDGDEFSLGLPHGPQGQFAIVASDVDEAPTIEGQPIQGPGQFITRDQLGPGYVYVKSLTGANLTAWLHGWNVALLLFSASLWDTTATWLTDRTWG